MRIYIDAHPFHYEMENLTRLFFPNEKLTVLHTDGTPLEAPYVYTHVGTSSETGLTVLEASMKTDRFSDSRTRTLSAAEASDEKTVERELALCLYDLLCRATGRQQPWGILTGVRPIKLFRRLSEEQGEAYARSYFREKLLVSEEKTNVSAVTEKTERQILSLSTPRSFSLYISIPFCPTRCSYCSFVSQTIERAKKLVDPYFDLLCQEISYTAAIVRDLGLVLESVYVGGGTPTTLSASQLSALIQAVRDNFDISSCREFTIEAGRPDTITEEKLAAILNGGVDRISINPQTLNDDVLAAIGRKHTAAQTLEAFELARKKGFRHINMDLIAGLPTETPESFYQTLDRICELSPESITVHTLALKKSSSLTLTGGEIRSHKESPAARMIRYAQQKLTDGGYHPYYLYRQSRMEGNLENTGWSKPGFEGLYNVFVMDETHTILGCGAGAVTKLKVPFSEELTRIFNYKYPYEYINGFDEMLKRKDGVKDFYEQLSEHLPPVCL